MLSRWPPDRSIVCMTSCASRRRCPAVVHGSNTNCDVACATVPCVAGTIPDGGPARRAELRPDKVVDSDSNVHPEFCKCTQAITGCNPPDTSEVFCQAPVAGIDSAGAHVRVLSKMVSLRHHRAGPRPVDARCPASLRGRSRREPRRRADAPARQWQGPALRPALSGAECDMLLDMELTRMSQFNFSAVVCARPASRHPRSHREDVDRGAWHDPCAHRRDGTGTSRSTP